MDEWMERRTDERTDEWMEGMDGWLRNGWMVGCGEKEIELILEASRTGLGWVG